MIRERVAAFRARRSGKAATSPLADRHAPTLTAPLAHTHVEAGVVEAPLAGARVDVGDTVSVSGDGLGPFHAKVLSVQGEVARLHVPALEDPLT